LLIDPVEAGSFYTEHFEQRPLHVARRRADYFRGLATLEDIDRIVTTLEVRPPDIRLVNAEREIEPGEYVGDDGLVDPAALFGLHVDGATIILNRLHALHPPLGDLCAALEAEFCAPFQTNVYVTPPGAQGFRAHFDTHDVFVAQVHGAKRWRVFGTPIELPLAGQAEDVDTAALGAPDAHFELEAGDTLYLPRGFVHDAVAADDTSVHVTVGILSYTWSDLMFEALASVVLSDAAFRRALPPGFARPDFDPAGARERFAELQAACARQADFDAVWQMMVHAFVATRRPRLAGQFAQARGLRRIEPDSRVAWRTGLVHAIERDEDRVRLCCDGKEMSFPGEYESVLRALLARLAFRVREVPGGLDDADRLVLVRRLVREGLLRAAQDEQGSGQV
jgi:ribosomal protein L16 Arg81 hydroxylase